MLFAVANRLRGSYGWFALVFGVALTGALYFISRDLKVSLLIGIGYWYGEMLCGWGDHIGNITVRRWIKFSYFPQDGDSVGVRCITSMIVYPKLWRLHLSNIKAGLYNLYPRTLNLAIKNWSLGRLLNVTVSLKPIEAFEIDRALTYSRVFLIVRGIYWWLLPMIGASILVDSYVAGLVGLLVLSLGWVVSSEIGYILSDKISFSFLGLNYKGGWELQEGVAGINQDIVLIGFIILYYIKV